MTTKFPAHRAHAGLWEGTYRHFNAADSLEAEFFSRVTCEFPQDGVFYRQTSEIRASDGTLTTNCFEGIDRGDHIWFDTPTFSGKSWETEAGQILLSLDRKDEPGARFVEVILLAPDGNSRVRTWHWFSDRGLYRRTLCNEVRIR